MGDARYFRGTLRSAHNRTRAAPRSAAWRGAARLKAVDEEGGAADRAGRRADLPAGKVKFTGLAQNSQADPAV